MHDGGDTVHIIDECYYYRMRVPFIHHSPFINHQKMLKIMEKVPTDLHDDLINTIWIKHYEGKPYVLDVLLELDVDTIRFILEYLKGKDDKDIIWNLNQFVLLEKNS